MGSLKKLLKFYLFIFLEKDAAFLIPDRRNTSSNLKTNFVWSERLSGQNIETVRFRNIEIDSSP